MCYIRSMRVAKLSDTTFPLRNLGRVFFVLPLLLSGCAISKGFLAGALGGVPYIDEIRHDEARVGSGHTELKVFGHESVIVWLAYGTIWPLAAAYSGASGLYGAYQFWKLDRDFSRDSLKSAAERTDLQKQNTERIQQETNHE